MNLERLRAETPGVQHRIHLNNAGASLMPTPVLEAVRGHLDLESRIGGYEAAEEARERLESVYVSIAHLVGAGPHEIALTENATVAWGLAFYALHFSPGDRILTARSEYAANYVAYLQVARRTGAVVEVIPNDASGATDPAALEQMFDHRVKLVSLSWIPTNGGLVNPAEAIGRITRDHGVTFLLDACQAVGQRPVDVQALGCDILAATGRKFLRGPRGTGFLYVRDALLQRLEPPMLDHYGAPWVAPEEYRLRGDARRFETWESNQAARLGLGAAVDYALALGLDNIAGRASGLARRLREGLARIPGARVHDLGREPCAIVSFTLEGVDSTAVKAALAGHNINVSVSDPPSTLMDARARDLPDLVRASPHYYNTEEEVDRCIDAVSGVAAGG